MNNKNKILIILSYLFLSSEVAWALDLNQVIAASYQNNDEIKAQEYQLRAQKSLRQKSMSGFLPKVAIDINQGDKSYQIGVNNTIKGDVSTRNFNITQPLFKGDAVFNFKKFDSEVKKEQMLLLSKKQAIAVQVIKFYIDVLRSSQLLKLEVENIKSYQRILDYTQKKIKAHDATKADLAKANADYISFVNNKAVLINNLSSARVSLLKLTDLSEDELSKLEELSGFKIHQKSNYLNQIDIAEVAFNNNPDLQAQLYSYGAAKFESFAAKAALAPSVSLVYQINEDRKSIYFNNQSQTDNSIFINVHIPLFSAGTEYADIGYTQNKEQQEKYNLQATRKKVAELAMLYLNDMNNLNSRYNSAMELEQANQIYVYSVEKEEKFGTKSIIDLLLAKSQLHQSQVEKINNYYDYIVAIFKIEGLLGNIGVY